MSKVSASWMSERLGHELTLVRWGEVGTPLLIFPTAGGDAEEIERFHLVGVLSDFLAASRVKIYSVDSLAGRSWFTEDKSTDGGARIQQRFDAALYHEVLPAIRQDCNDDAIEIVTSGASLGAYNALAFLCRHPDAVSAAICLSGTYGLTKFLEGPMTRDFYEISPIHFVPDLVEESEQLAQLRRRFVLLAHGEGVAESPEEDWTVARVLGARGVPNRVDNWGPDWPHDWVTWREMLPKYVGDLLGSGDAGSEEE
jgi:esterase/lipase superfamily enzyme